MKPSKTLPLRTCVGCGRQKHKSELVRVVKRSDGSIFLDETRKAFGRGAYVCRNVDCLQAAKKKRRLERSFKGKIPPELYLELEERLKQNE